MFLIVSNIFFCLTLLIHNFLSVTLEDPRFVWNYKTRSMVGRFCVPDITWIKEIGLWAEDLWAEYSHHGMDVVRVVQRLFADVTWKYNKLSMLSFFSRV